MRHMYKPLTRSVSKSAGSLVPSPTPDQIQTRRPPTNRFREQVKSNFIPPSGSKQLVNGDVCQLHDQEYPSDDESTIQAIENFSKSLNEFTSRLKSTFPDDPIAWEKYQQDIFSDYENGNKGDSESSRRKSGISKARN